MVTIPENTDVLIVGAGPVGMTTAIMLAKHGIRGVIIDKAEEIFRQPRAISLDNEALRILQWAGVDDSDFKQVAIARVKFKSPIFGEIACANSAGVIDCHPKLVTFYQPELEAVLDKAVTKKGAFKLIRGLSLEHFTDDEQGITATVKDSQGQQHDIRCRFMVGADGANSQIRKTLGLDFTRGRRYAEDWLIIDADNKDLSKRDYNLDYIEFLCDHKRTVPHMPAPNGKERWEFKLRANEDPQDFLCDAKTQELLTPWFPNNDAQIERKAIYRFQAKTAPNFSKGNSFLVGDAAHVTPPFVGQGLVAGLRDAANLSWKLAAVLQKQADQKILESYDQERRPHAKSMVRLAVMAGKIIMPKNFLAAALTHGTVSLLKHIPYLRNLLQELEIKPKNRFRKGLFMPRVSASKVDRGNHLPQTWLTHRDGQKLRSDDLMKGQFQLIGVGYDPVEHLSKDAKQKWRAFGGEVLQLCHKSQQLNRIDHEHCWEDEFGTIVPNFASIGRLIIVRPDQVVMTDGPLENADSLVEEALSLLGYCGPEVINRAILQQVS